MHKKIKESLKFRYENYRYKHFTKSVEMPSYKYEILKEDGFYSQCGQDKWLKDKVFINKNEGVFVDIGAHDGVSFSNSYYFEKLGWTGIAVEPMPDVFERLSVARNCQTVNACIASQTGKRTFRVIKGYSQMLSGLVDEYDYRHLQRIENEMQKNGGSFTDIDVACINFNELIQKYNVSHIDYLSIDIEGGELSVLHSIDFDRVNISVIGVENNYLDYRIPQFLYKKGFQLHAILGDEIYLRKDYF